MGGMTAGHGPPSPVELPRRTATARASSLRWTERAGAHLLAVDPQVDERFRLEMASRGVHVTAVDSTLDGLIEFGRLAPSAVLVAPSTPGISPSQFIETIRAHTSPVIIALREPGDDRTAGELLLAGAIATLSRPCSASDVWAVLQRSATALENHGQVSLGPIELDAAAYTVRLHGERLPDLPLKEFELLMVLMLRAPDVLSNDELRDALWGTSSGRPTSNTISAHVGRLRGRLNGVADVRRVHGRGYALTPAAGTSFVSEPAVVRQ